MDALDLTYEKFSLEFFKSTQFLSLQKLKSFVEFSKNAYLFFKFITWFYLSKNHVRSVCHIS